MQASEPGIVYTPRPDATPEGELNALVNVYRFLLDHANKKTAEQAPKPGGSEDVRKDLDAHTATE